MDGENKKAFLKFVHSFIRSFIQIHKLTGGMQVEVEVEGMESRSMSMSMNMTNMKMK